VQVNPRAPVVEKAYKSTQVEEFLEIVA